MVKVIEIVRWFKHKDEHFFYPIDEETEFISSYCDGVYSVKVVDVENPEYSGLVVLE